MPSEDSRKNAARTTPAQAKKRNASSLVLLASISAGIYVCYLIVLPFLPALTFALVLAILFAPLHTLLDSRLKRPSVSALLSVLTIAVIVVAPATFVGQRLIVEVSKGAAIIQALIEKGAWRHVIDEHPWIAPAAAWVEKQVNFPALAGTAASWLTNTAASFVRGSVTRFIEIVVTFYLLFYFLRDWRLAVETLIAYSPLTKDETLRLFQQIAGTVHATIYGTIVVGAVQGTLGGLMFWWLELPAPLLWGSVMAVLAIVPVLGAFMVWIPASVFLMLDGQWEKALILAAWGGLVISTIDNLLYPVLVGDRLQMHTVPAFISFVGGLALLGPSGIVLGPLAVILTFTLYSIWQKRQEDPEG